MKGPSEKKTVFVSHSSADAAFVPELCELLARYTGRTLEIFCASGGQSVRLGRNWVSELEQGLLRSSLCLIVLTPEAERSGWIHFEAGVAYARETRVVPLGFFGADVSSLGPPLGLLQGFNVVDAKGLNNLIALVNDVFDVEFPEAFQEEDYRRLELLARFDGARSIDPALELFETIGLELEREGCPALQGSLPTVIDRICEGLREHGLEARVDRGDEWNLDSITTRGLKFVLWEKDGETSRIRVDLSPLVLRSVFAVAAACLGKLAGEELTGVSLKCLGREWTQVGQPAHEILARLFDTPIRLGAEGFELDGMSIRLWDDKRRAHVEVQGPMRRVDGAWIESLLRNLVGRGIARRHTSVEREDIQFQHRTHQQRMHEQQMEFHREARERAMRASQQGS